MVLKNARIVNENFSFEYADIKVEGEKIAAIGTPGSFADDEAIDLSGCTLLPGFIDIHIHGGGGSDVCDGTPEALDTISRHLIKHGVTSFCPTTLTLSEESLGQILENVRICAENGLTGAYIQGVNLEGPYISMAKKGAQNGKFVRTPDPDEFGRLNAKSGNLIRLVDIAPEEDVDHRFIKEIAPDVTVSIAHTSAKYEDAAAGFASGITHATHLFNAMSGFNHRAPGVVGAIFDSKTVTAEIICDGFHIHPAVIRVAFNTLGEDRMVVISDACSGAGMPDGTIKLGELDVFVVDGKARLADGTIASPTSDMLEEFRNLISFGIPYLTAVKASTINPAKIIRVDGVTGSLKSGKFADIIALDDDLNIKLVMRKGETI